MIRDRTRRFSCVYLSINRIFGHSTAEFMRIFRGYLYLCGTLKKVACLLFDSKSPTHIRLFKFFRKILIRQKTNKPFFRIFL